MVHIGKFAVLCSSTARSPTSIRTASINGLISRRAWPKGVVVVPREEGGRGCLALSL